MCFAAACCLLAGASYGLAPAWCAAQVNVSPDLASTSPLDKQLKHNLAADMMHVVGVKLPPSPPAAAAASGGASAADGGADGVAPAAADEGKESPILGRALTGRDPSQLAGVALH